MHKLFLFYMNIHICLVIVAIVIEATFSDINEILKLLDYAHTVCSSAIGLCSYSM